MRRRLRPRRRKLVRRFRPQRQWLDDDEDDDDSELWMSCGGSGDEPKK